MNKKLFACAFFYACAGLNVCVHVCPLAVIDQTVMATVLVKKPLYWYLCGCLIAYWVLGLILCVRACVRARHRRSACEPWFVSRRECRTASTHLTLTALSEYISNQTWPFVSFCSRKSLRAAAFCSQLPSLIRAVVGRTYLPASITQGVGARVQSAHRTLYSQHFDNCLKSSCVSALIPAVLHVNTKWMVLWWTLSWQLSRCWARHGRWVG